jgi:hypothetical protein
MSDEEEPKVDLVVYGQDGETIEKEEKLTQAQYRELRAANGGHPWLVLYKGRTYQTIVLAGEGGYIKTFWIEPAEPSVH